MTTENDLHITECMKCGTIGTLRYSWEFKGPICYYDGTACDLRSRLRNLQTGMKAIAREMEGHAPHIPIIMQWAAEIRDRSERAGVGPFGPFPAQPKVIPCINQCVNGCPDCQGR